MKRRYLPCPSCYTGNPVENDRCARCGKSLRQPAEPHEERLNRLRTERNDRKALCKASALLGIGLLLLIWYVPAVRNAPIWVSEHPVEAGCYLLVVIIGLVWLLRPNHWRDIQEDDDNIY